MIVAYVTLLTYRTTEQNSMLFLVTEFKIDFSTDNKKKIDIAINTEITRARCSRANKGSWSIFVSTWEGGRLPLLGFKSKVSKMKSKQMILLNKSQCLGSRNQPLSNLSTSRGQQSIIHTLVFSLSGHLLMVPKQKPEDKETYVI